jgi:hypothetical protein
MMKIKNRITRDVAVGIIKSGKICSVKFVKRSTDTVRVLNGRSGVKRYLKGGPAPYNAKEHNLIVFYDMKEAAYKSIPIERVLAVNGKQVI